ncbi:FIG01115797: hypothetical protein [Streptococcus pyogenes]|nr:hypothetical protein M3B_1673 [Streptococcus pyogenes]SDV81669.1 FIG01115797: hypothetical protein [Streptococcus pyogenes]
MSNTKRPAKQQWFDGMSLFDSSTPTLLKKRRAQLSCGTRSSVLFCLAKVKHA